MATPGSATSEGTEGLPPPPAASKLRAPKANGSKITQPQIEREHDAELDAANEDKEAKVAGERTSKPERIPPEPIRELQRAENQELVDWLNQIRGGAAVQIAIKRIKPTQFKGKLVAGHLETREDIISEDEIRDTWGGGEYQLRVKRRNAQGSWVILTSTTVPIAGDPRLDNLPGGSADAASAGMSAASYQADADTKIAQSALAMMERQMQQVRDQQSKSGMDAKMIEQFMKPMELQVELLQKQLTAKDQQFADQVNKPADPFQQKLLEKFVDGDQARVNALRTQYESEIRVIKENHASDIKRLEDRQDRTVSDLRRDYERQLDNQKSGYERELASVKALHQQMDVSAASSTAIIKSSLDRDLARLEREVADLKLENKALREKKDKNVLDMVKEVNEFKEILGVEEGGGEKSAIERIAEAAMSSDQLLSFVGKWVGPKDAAPAAAPQQQQLAQTPPRYVRDKRTGQVGEWNPVLKRYEEVQQRRKGKGQQGGASTDPAELDINPEHLQMAITVLERSFANRTPPKNFAATISTALPPEIFQAIRDHGVDGFVNKVAKLGASSPLRRQEGINWLREVGKVLLGDESPPQQDDDIDGLGDDLNDAPDDDLLT